jgi:hypothetical protein
MTPTYGHTARQVWSREQPCGLEAISLVSQCNRLGVSLSLLSPKPHKSWMHQNISSFR